MSDSEEVIINKVRLSSAKEGQTDSILTALKKPGSKPKNNKGSNRPEFVSKKSAERDKNRLFLYRSKTNAKDSLKLTTRTLSP
jgi:hypothetical protein